MICNPFCSEHTHRGVFCACSRDFIMFAVSGYMIFPDSMKTLLDATFIAASETHTSVSAPVQYAACAAFDNSNREEIRNYLTLKRAVLGALAQKSYDALQSITGCKVVKPDGGFYIFPDFTNAEGMDRLVQRWMDREGKGREDWNSKLRERGPVVWY